MDGKNSVWTVPEMTNNDKSADRTHHHCICLNRPRTRRSRIFVHKPLTAIQIPPSPYNLTPPRTQHHRPPPVSNPSLTPLNHLQRRPPLRTRRRTRRHQLHPSALDPHTSTAQPAIKNSPHSPSPASSAPSPSPPPAAPRRTQTQTARPATARSC